MNPKDLTYLGFLIDKHPPLFKKVLLHETVSLWEGENFSEFQKKYHAIACHPNSTPSLAELFHLFLAARLVTASPPPSPDVQTFFRQEIDFNKYLGFQPFPLEKGRWCTVPVIFTGEGRAHIRFFVVGLLDKGVMDGLLPSWARVLFDRTALAAVETAARVAQNFAGNPHGKSLYCFPLTVPGKTIQFKEGSLALPLAVGFVQLLKNQPVTRKMIATGALAPDGTLREIGHLETKIEHIASAYHGILYPRQNSHIGRMVKPVTIPVSDLSQAWMFFSLYSEDYADKLSLLAGIHEDPLLFAENIGHLPGPWIDWMHQGRSILPTVAKVVADGEIFRKFLENFETLVQGFHLPHAASVSRLISDHAVGRLAQDTPLAALKWCTANLSLANHQGEVETGVKWKKQGASLVKRVLEIDIAPVTEFFNHQFVACHNQYIFHPGLPDELGRLLTYLESQYQLKCKFGCPTDLLLGRLYGTILQNYAFCGPGHIKTVEALSEKSRTALGENRVPEFKPEWIRQYSYLTFARLDAGDIPGAAYSLCRYLETDCLEDLLSGPKSFSPWHYALLARFFSQVPDHPAVRDFFGLLLSGFNTCHGLQHPWQLIAYNLGRIALGMGRADQAKDLLKKSMELCLGHSSGPTIQVMALLPLSQLAHLEGEKIFKKIHAQWKKAIRSAAASLDSGHFRFLTENGFEKALEIVRNDPGAIFPFSYH